VQAEKSGTLGCGNDQTIFCLQGDGIDRADTAGCNGKGWRENTCYTLNTIDRPAVCAGFKLGNSEQARSIGYQEELSPTLNAECGGNKPAVVALDMTHACDVIRECGQIVPSLQARMGTGGNQVPLTYQMNGFGDYRAAEVASSCKQRDFKDSTDLVITHMVVRRLTPMECERLQGFPDRWTDIGEWTDEKGKKHKDADSPRYKALGNSIALPFWDWMLRRMARYLPEHATLGSLFDGIGGFPLVWQETHGDYTARWASEIEEFPIAVTKLRFPEPETKEKLQ
jgi:DNA (cytosine-5)-methyltransferase 1